MEHPPSSSLWTGQAPAAERSSQLLIRDYPHRAIAIASHSHALILRHSSTTTEAIASGSLASIPSARTRGGDGGASKCIVEFTPTSSSLLSDYRPLTPRPIYGTLGLISIDRDVFLCVITQASRVATLRPGETVERILTVEFFCLNTNAYDDVLSVDPWDVNADASSAYSQGLSRRDVGIEHPCQELQKLLSNGTFYYSTDFDLTNRMQDRPVDSAAFDIDNFDESFLWNSYMIQPLVQFRSRLQPPEREVLDASRILTSAIRGFCLTMAIPQSSAPLRSTRSGMPSYLTVISRLSCRRAGTRFNSRGIDDDGNVANFVETETVYWSPSGVVFSYAQVRGSVPVFWEQTAGLIPGQQKITVTRSADGTQPAFDKHFEDLEHAYGAVHVVNLLSETKPGEAELSQCYRLGIQRCPLSQRGDKLSRDHALLQATEYDFHAETKGPQGYEAARQIRHYIEHSADGFAYYLAQEADDADEKHGAQNGHRRSLVVLQQEGVFRTNCLDCLDRTNLIQTLISQMAVEAFLGHRGEFAPSDFWMRHSSLWADNGDALSRTYAGTGALKSSFTRHGKMSLAGAIADARKSATRLYINNFADKGRQNTIDILLGRIYGQAPVVLFDPINDYVTSELNKRSGEFSSSEVINMWVGTFNLNGRTDGINEDLSPWLCPPILEDTQPEIFAVGFQEIVELSPQQIMNSDPRRKQLWEESVKRTLNKRAQAMGGESYVLLRSGQLVGAALCIFVKSSILREIKNVEGNVKKTGMSGMAGNKGAVAIRFDYANTHICFVTAHLAAGFANYDERNRDYATIHHGLRFARNRGIDDHDTVIWMGDFNYRIGLSREKVDNLIAQRDLERLYENDQLNLQMVAGLSFPFYSEARITFLPTYRFDIGKDSYDSSEKQRIPAWTDRILRKGTNLRQLSYNSAPLKFSDHRPVYATFDCTVSIVDEELRDRIRRQLYDRRKLEVGDATANLNTAEDTDDEDLIGYDAIEPGLPPASSDRQKWWLENGKLARSTVTPPKPPSSAYSTVLNPNRPSNPWAATDEPDWVAVPRSESRLSSFSSISTSPYEHINHSAILSSSASSQPPRKLPPPYDPSGLPAKVGRPNGLEGQNQMQVQQKQEVPPPPPPRRQTGTPSNKTPTSSQALPTLPSRTPTMPIMRDAPRSTPQAQSNDLAPLPPRPRSATSSVSQQSTTKAKSPPPVAKKPAHLTSLSPVSTPTLQQGADLGSSALPIRAHSPSASSVASSRGGLGNYVTRDEEVKPPRMPPRRVGTAEMPARKATPGAGAVGLPGMIRKEEEARSSAAAAAPPKLPARKPSVPVHKKHVLVPEKQQQNGQSMDLLGDDTGAGNVGGWEALKPT
ncbi:uncharacterized protein E0L32_003592 [Thyridium curvatum]|uniref:phosphoinositide 5-phosphatase n=1 Tax=Thyridium curvatum TaxID=1093900 RepID=A0A507BI40_9PEZI|nr:uncharacterized protein E0L32_003592 [Thyridium curvatum]TPX16651.1 hypothetical protein E0L32_003592 [Thyridium curvatum]